MPHGLQRGAGRSWSDPNPCPRLLTHELIPCPLAQEAVCAREDIIFREYLSRVSSVVSEVFRMLCFAPCELLLDHGAIFLIRAHTNMC